MRITKQDALYPFATAAALFIVAYFYLLGVLEQKAEMRYGLVSEAHAETLADRLLDCRDDALCIEARMLEGGYRWTKKGWQFGKRR